MASECDVTKRPANKGVSSFADSSVRIKVETQHVGSQLQAYPMTVSAGRGQHSYLKGWTLFFVPITLFRDNQACKGGELAQLVRARGR